MLTLYHAPRSRSSRIVWLLEELGVPYAIRPVSIFRPITGEGASDPANPHPDKRVPLLVHDEALIAESVAIVLYLTDAFPAARLGAPVGDPRRGAYLTWLAWYAAEMEPALLASLGGELAASPMKRRNHDAVVGRIVAALSKGPYVMGDRLTGADLLVAGALAFGRHAFPADPTLDAYVDRCRSRPACARAQALDDGSGVQHPR